MTPVKNTAQNLNYENVGLKAPFSISDSKANTLKMIKDHYGIANGSAPPNGVRSIRIGRGQYQ
jgi:hypothetical protein